MLSFPSQSQKNWWGLWRSIFSFSSLSLEKKHFVLVECLRSKMAEMEEQIESHFFSMDTNVFVVVPVIKEICWWYVCCASAGHTWMAFTPVGLFNLIGSVGRSLLSHPWQDCCHGLCYSSSASHMSLTVLQRTCWDCIWAYAMYLSR